MVSIKVVSAAVKLVAAGARHDIDRAVGRQAGRKIEVGGRELKLLHDLLGDLQASADRANGDDVCAVYCDTGVSDARGCKNAGAEHRHKDAVVRGRGGVGHARFQLCKVQKVSPVEWQVLNLIAADQAGQLMVV